MIKKDDWRWVFVQRIGRPEVFLHEKCGKDHALDATQLTGSIEVLGALADDRGQDPGAPATPEGFLLDDMLEHLRALRDVLSTGGATGSAV